MHNGFTNMFVIAKNTIKEFIRNRLLYFMLGSAVVLIFLTIIISKLALSEQTKVVLDFSFTIIEFAGLIFTLFLGSSLLYNEITKNTILLILSKNPSRAKFILGKFLGFASILFFLYIVLGASFLAVLWIHNISFDFIYIWALFFSYLKILVLVGFLIFFSTFMSPFFSLLVSLGVYIIAHMTAFLKFYSFASKKVLEGSLGGNFINAIFYIFPNFQDLSIKEYLLSPDLSNYGTMHIGLSLVSNLFYLAILLFLAILIFQKREF